ncbi:putative ribonuclease H-like domain-containing protein [Tanacetum coccineum]
MDHLGKFDRKADEGFFIRYTVVSKAMRVFNKRTKIVEETLNIRFYKNAPNVTGNGPDWLFDVDSLTISMNYVPVVAGKQTNGIAGTRDYIVTGQAEKKTEPKQEFILIPFCTTDLLISQGPKDSEEDSGMKHTEVDESGALDKDGKDDQATRSDTPVSAAGPSFTNDDLSSPVNVAEASNAFEEHLFERFSPFKNAFTLPPVSNATPIDDTGIFGNAYDDEDVGAEANLNNLETTMNVFRNKKDERGIVVRNKARLVTQGYTQEERIDYDEVFARVARIEAIRRGTIDKNLFIKKDKGDILLVQVYVDDIIFGSTKKSLCDEFEQMMHKKFQMSSMGELTFFLGLQVQQKKDGIFISQDKYMADILKKFDFATMKTSSTPMESNKALLKDEEADSVDIHLYRSMIGSLMYLTASRPDIMFVVCACARFQVTPKMSHLHAIVIMLELALTGNLQQEVLWIQNQMLDYEFNFMNTKIYIDNESTICIVKNLVFHSKTKHIEIRYHFIRDCYEKKMIRVIKIHTDYNVADLLTEDFDIKENAEFHQIVDFLSTCSINYALTVSPTIYASYIEQFWNTATSKTVNSVKQIHAIIDGKVVVISESPGMVLLA